MLKWLAVLGEDFILPLFLSPQALQTPVLNGITDYNPVTYYEEDDF